MKTGPLPSTRTHVLPPSSMQRLGAITRTKKPEAGREQAGVHTAALGTGAGPEEGLEGRGCCVCRVHYGDEVRSVHRWEKIGEILQSREQSSQGLLLLQNTGATQVRKTLASSSGSILPGKMSPGQNRSGGMASKGTGKD